MPMQLMGVDNGDGNKYMAVVMVMVMDADEMVMVMMDDDVSD